MNVRFLAAALTVCAALPSQSRNTTLLGSWNPATSNYFNDVWGYRDANTDKEYALVGASNGFYVVDCSVPSAPVERGFFSGVNSIWRDIRVWQTYAYVVTEGEGGMRIYDLSNPDSPQFVRRHTGGLNWSNSHNISIDLQTGMCYAVGTSGGVHIFDLNTNPTNPAYVTSYTDEYVHDMQVRDGIGHFAEINRGQYRVVDLRNLPTITSLGTVRVSVCHTAFPTRDNRYGVTTSETTSSRRDFGRIRVFDLANQSSPTLRDDYIQSTGTSSHNAFVIDYVIHASHYAAGYRAIDMSDPTNILEVASYDTNTATSGFDGSWGCYPFNKSGIIFETDQDNGLFVVASKATTEEYGVGTPGTGGNIPTLHTKGTAFLGNSNFAIEVDDGPASANGTLLISTRRSSLTFMGLSLLVDTVGGSGLIANTSANAAGNSSTSIPVPNIASLNGLTLHAQAFVVDAGGPLNLSATSGRTFEVFTR